MAMKVAGVEKICISGYVQKHIFKLCRPNYYFKIPPIHSVLMTAYRGEQLLQATFGLAE
jgi:hypothetical protein